MRFKEIEIGKLFFYGNRVWMKVNWRQSEFEGAAVCLARIRPDNDYPDIGSPGMFTSNCEVVEAKYFHPIGLALTKFGEMKIGDYFYNCSKIYQKITYKSAVTLEDLQNSRKGLGYDCYFGENERFVVIENPPLNGFLGLSGDNVPIYKGNIVWGEMNTGEIVSGYAMLYLGEIGFTHKEDEHYPFVYFERENTFSTEKACLEKKIEKLKEQIKKL